MKAITPNETARRLGWKEARQSLKETRGITAPKPPRLTWRIARTNPRTIWPWLKSWLCWPFRTLKFWRTLWEHSRKDFVKEYTALAKQGVDSREIFKQTGRRMHLTEDEISQHGRRILSGEFPKL